MPITRFRGLTAKSAAPPTRGEPRHDSRPPQGAGPGLPRFLGRPAAGPEPRVLARLEVGAAGDAFENEADQLAGRLARPASAASPEAGPKKALAAPLPRPAGASAGAPSRLAQALGTPGQPLDGALRSDLETRFGTPLQHVRVHTGAAAARLNENLGARAFTQGNDIFFGPGERPGSNPLTTHELAHVLQQGGGLAADSPVGRLSARAGAPLQCSFSNSYAIPGRSDGTFEIDLQTREGALATPATKSGLDGYIRFVPAAGAPNSNVIAMTQIARTTDAGGTDVQVSSMPAAQAPRGALGTPGLRTAADPLSGVEGGFATDVHHRPRTGAPGVPQGSFLSPRYNFQPAAPGTVGGAGQTAQPAIYGGGIGGVVGQTPGFKRSDDPADIRSAVMYDFPGTASATLNLDFSFESAALGEDTLVTYGVVNWGFGLRAGHVVNERLDIAAGQSATFAEALERHRDFYVHEPVTFYFPFDSAVLSAAESAKIDTFTAYLTRNPDVELNLEGFADQVGGASDYNLDLSLRRAAAVETALLGHGIAAARLNPIQIGRGASTSATGNAGTGDQGGNAALGADQSREANRWANRRVVLSFAHRPAAGP